MPNNKSPGNDSLTKKFCKPFYGEIKITLRDSTMKSYQNGELSSSQKQAVIKVIKRTRNQSENERLKKVLPSLISKT